MLPLGILRRTCAALIFLNIAFLLGQADNAFSAETNFENSPTYQKFFGSGSKQKKTPSSPPPTPIPQPQRQQQGKPVSFAQPSDEKIKVEGVSHNAQNVIGKEEMSHFAAGTDPLKVLADSTPGASYSDGQFRLRGFNERQVGFTMDGIPLDGPPPLIPENLGGI